MSTQDFPEFREPGTTAKITSLWDFSAEALGQLKFWLEQSGLNIPIGQVLGFSQFTATLGSVADTSQSVVSTSYADGPDEAGPTLSGLADGSYVLIYGANMLVSGAGVQLLMAPSVNGEAAADTDACQSQSTTSTSVCKALTKTLSAGGNNSIEFQYRVTSGSGTLGGPWAIALRYANA